ncbi:MAG: hypothetical protein ABEJ81_02705 [Haloferacaceae archaeon]
MRRRLAHFLRSCLPAWIALAGYAAFVPLTEWPAWASLAWYQQTIVLVAFPALVWSVYRYNVGLVDVEPTPEERVLDDAEGWTSADD